MNEDLKKIIDEQVRIKSRQLSSWQNVRWQGGRIFYESSNILSEINDYDLETQILYLEKLLEQNFILQDNLAHSAPDVTIDFKLGLSNHIAKLKIKNLQNINIPKFKPNNRKKRPAIPQKIKALLQREINSKCVFCNNEDVDHFEFHHIDENPENNAQSNLLMLCPICHSKITKKDISTKKVLEMKNRLTQAAAANRL
jgi:hypothetical protein